MTAYKPLQRQVSQWPEPRPAPQQSPTKLETHERQMADFSAQSKAAIDEVRKLYVLTTDSSVRAFLTEHRTLPQVLLEAAPGLASCFGAQAVVELKTLVDGSGSQTLYAAVKWPGSLQEVREALQRFDDTWWMQHSRSASDYLVFTYELV